MGMRWLQAISCLALFFLCAVTAGAAVRKVEPGKIPKLDQDEGLLALVVDSSTPLKNVIFKKDGSLFGGQFRNLGGGGATAQLYVVSAGTYQWNEIQAWFGVRYELEDRPQYRFTVQPGVITYPGDLVVRASNLFSPEINVLNRSLQMMDWLEEMHPDLWRQYRVAYSGYYPDPFPEIYRAARATSTASLQDLQTVRRPPGAGSAPLSIVDLWRRGRVHDVSMNSAGDLLAKVVWDGGQWAVELVDLTNNSTVRLTSGPAPVAALEWASDRVLVISSGPSARGQTVGILRIAKDATGKITSEYLTAPHYASFFHVVPGDPDHVIIGSTHGINNELWVHRVPTTSQKALDRTIPQRGSRLNVHVPNDLYWLTDGNGQLRLAMARRGDDLVLMHGQGKAFTEVMHFKADSNFEPMELSFDGNLIYGLSDENRGQRDLVVFDTATRSVTKTLFSKPGVDIVAPVIDIQRKPIGATYYQNGQLVTEYFDQASSDVSASMQVRFPDRTVLTVARSADGRHAVLLVGGSDQPAQLFHMDTSGKQVQVSLIDETMPWLDAKKLVPSKVLTLKAADGMPIEAYLTLPPGDEKRPLLVLSHGGPVGVRDERYFDPEVQFLASRGYAVLQVNFRGSEGYGRSFREAGVKGHGTVIEDDIDAAIRYAVERYPLDEQRMCAMGSSYGGYSALISAIRWPTRFRCAVSISGVADRLLFFTASDGGSSPKGRERLERYIGNPNTDQEAMMQTSPLYRYRELTTPIMLVHGTEGMRVDYEHTRRIVRMLNMAGRRPVVVTLDDEGHGFDAMKSIEQAWSGIAGFLQKNLEVKAPAAAEKVSASAAQK